jgi:hypothetical protein
VHFGPVEPWQIIRNMKKNNIYTIPYLFVQLLRADGLREVVGDEQDVVEGAVDA